MAYTRSQSVKVLLKAVFEPADAVHEEFRDLELLEVAGDDTEPAAGQRTSAEWVREELQYAKLTDLFLDGVPDVPDGHVLIVTGHAWNSGPDWTGEYDGGFEVDSVAVESHLPQGKLR